MTEPKEKPYRVILKEVRKLEVRVDAVNAGEASIKAQTPTAINLANLISKTMYLSYVTEEED